MIGRGAGEPDRNPRSPPSRAKGRSRLRSAKVLGFGAPKNIVKASAHARGLRWRGAYLPIALTPRRLQLACGAQLFLSFFTTSTTIPSPLLFPLTPRPYFDIVDDVENDEVEKAVSALITRGNQPYLLTFT